MMLHGAPDRRGHGHAMELKSSPGGTAGHVCARCGTSTGVHPIQPSSDHIRFAAGLWAREEGLHAKVNRDYLRFSAQRHFYRSRRVPALGHPPALLAWLYIFAGFIGFVASILLLKCRLYLVRGTREPVPAEGQQLLCMSLMIGKRHTHYLGIRTAEERQSWVYKVAHSRAQFDAEVATREHLGRYFALAPYTLDDVRLTFKEHYVYGAALVEATPRQQLTAVQQLIGAYTRLAAETPPVGYASGASLLTRIQQDPTLCTFHDNRWREVVEGLADMLAGRTERYLCIYGHNDLTGTNVIVAQNANPLLIDFERAARGVFFADILWLILDLAMRKQRACLTELQNGTLDVPLAELWRAAGCRYERDDLAAYACMAICAKTANDIELMGSGCWSARTFTERVRQARSSISSPCVHQQRRGSVDRPQCRKR
jgi:hypothetical protein